MKEPELFPFKTLQDGQFEYWSKIHHPFTGGIEITTQCNFNCIHCYLKDDHSKLNYLSTSQIKSIIDDLYSNGVLYIYITGGEIFLREDFCEIYIYAKKKGFLITLLTNLSLLTEKIIKILKEYPPLLVSVSLYGATNETYKKITGISGFNTVFNNLLLLKKNRITFEVKYVLMKENKREFEKAKEIVEKTLNMEFNYYYELFPTFRGNNTTLSHMLSYDEIIEIEKSDTNILDYRRFTYKIENPFINSGEKKEFYCLGGACRFFIDSKGFVYPCHKLRIKTKNVLECEFKKIWNDFIKVLDKPATVNNKCINCRYLMFCQPCPGENLLYNNQPGKPNEQQCKLTKLRIQELINDGREVKIDERM